MGYRGTRRGHRRNKGPLDVTTLIAVSGDGGRVTTPLGIGRALARQHDGKYVVAGEGTRDGESFALARYTSAARRAGSSARRPVRSGRKAPASGLNTTEVREWAKAQGIEVRDRGRVPSELLVKFQAASGRN